MVDAADHDKLDQAKSELHSLLEKPQLTAIPVSLMPFCSLFHSQQIERFISS